MMSTSGGKEPKTLVEGLLESIGRALRTGEGQAAPVAVLWTDPEASWRPVIERIRSEFPALYSFGPYSPGSGIGPTIWLKCLVDRTVPEAPSADVTPILYLPKVSRQELRSGEDCRAELQPMVELLYRGRAWHQDNGKDWSVEAFLISEEGLGLDVARDSATRDAVIRALPVLSTTPLEGLRGRRLDAFDFDRLTVPDPVRDLLRWLSDPASFKAGLTAAHWETFCQRSQADFAVNPADDDREAAARLLVEGRGNWDQVWARFCESPRAYRGVAALLRSSNLTSGLLPFESGRSPAENDQAEAELRKDLDALTRLPFRDACAKVLNLEREHGGRRMWVWNELGESPLAQALVPLAKLATLSQLPSSGSTLQPFAAWYAQDGWRCDRAAMDALALALPPALRTLVAGVVRALYEPWLDGIARLFQGMAAGDPGALGQANKSGSPADGTCLVFGDGLRFDIGAMLREKLELRDCVVTMAHRLAPVPTVTATAKPLSTLVAAALTGPPATDDFTPLLSSTKQPATITRLRDEMAGQGIDVMEGDDLHVPAGPRKRGWSETGRLDELGHKLGLGLAPQLDQELEALVDRIVGLLECGWARVRVVTDHGWLLVPGGLPKIELPTSLAASKWARCASITGESPAGIPIFAWHWHPDVRVASPPGIGSFFAGMEYAHGGISPQECILPELTVERPSEIVRVSIADLQWRGMRLRVRVAPPTAGLKVDVRRNAKQESTSVVTAPKELDAGGEASVVVANDDDEGTAAVVVVLGPGGTILDRKTTTVGEHS
jgi:hypothetical protein